MIPIAQFAVDPQAKIVIGPLHFAILTVAYDTFEDDTFAANHCHIIRLLNKERLVWGRV